MCSFSLLPFFQDLSVLLVKADGTLKSPLSRLLCGPAREQLLQTAQARPGDLLLLSAGPLDTVVGRTHKPWPLNTRPDANYCLITV